MTDEIGLLPFAVIPVVLGLIVVTVGIAVASIYPRIGPLDYPLTRKTPYKHEWSERADRVSTTPVTGRSCGAAANFCFVPGGDLSRCSNAARIQQ
jgi:hypothetical protein